MRPSFFLSVLHMRKRSQSPSIGKTPRLGHWYTSIRFSNSFLLSPASSEELTTIDLCVDVVFCCCRSFDFSFGSERMGSGNGNLVQYFTIFYYRDLVLWLRCLDFICQNITGDWSSGLLGRQDDVPDGRQSRCSVSASSTANTVLRDEEHQHCQ